jgi:valyl-tRNA synthetase
MLARYENWVKGLNQDWCISRQRFFGVPFPVWYHIDPEGRPDYAHPILASLEQLPVDPMSDVPPGFRPEQRDQKEGFTGDVDVMDTWATSSLTPQIASHWAVNPARHAKLFPMDIRPQAHEIIRTWAFATIVKAWMHEKQVPWKHVLISGWILDPDRKKMSKSKGNVVTPEGLLQEYSSDAVRYWAGRARLGVDTAFDLAMFKIGQKLVTKIFNASRFVVMQLESAGELSPLPGVSGISEPLDLSLVEKLRDAISRASSSFDEFDYAGALQLVEGEFWQFCDYYVELVKNRTYHQEDSSGRRSGCATLAWSLKIFLRLFAPFLPYITEEVWSWLFTEERPGASVHLAAWPSLAEVESVTRPAYAHTYDAAIEVTAKIRQAKAHAQKGMKYAVSRLEIGGTVQAREALLPALKDVLAAGNVAAENCSLSDAAAGAPGQLFDVKVTLAAVCSGKP